MTPYNWNFPYSWPRKPVLAANVVATTQPLAAQAGLRMMLQGGNAVDAILATAITLTLVEPVSNGIGSDLFAILWDGKELHGINSSGRSPEGWTPEYFAKTYPDLKAMPTRGWNTVTVPGCVAGWKMLSERFGKLPFEKLFEPAIGYGRNGFLVSPTIARQWAVQAKELHVQPGYAEAFMPGGRPPEAGEIFRFPDHAATLEKIAATKGETFYRGEIAEKLVAHSAQHGGVMKASDLAAHQSDWTPPMEIGYRGYTVHELPPNGQGIVALIALGILEQFDVSSFPVDSADSLHLQIEATKMAFADARRFVADMDWMDIKPEALLNRDYLKSRAKLLDMKKAQDFGHGTPPKGGTVYLTAADAGGMSAKPGAPPAHRDRIARRVAKASSVFRARCCTPGPPWWSRKVWIWDGRAVPCVGSFRGSSTFSALLARTTELSPESTVPTSAAVNSANSLKPVAAMTALAAGSRAGTFPTAWSRRARPMVAPCPSPAPGAAASGTYPARKGPAKGPETRRRRTSP